MTNKPEKKYEYVQSVQNGQLVTHKVIKQNKKLSKKKHIIYKTSNINGKVVTEIVYEQ